MNYSSKHRETRIFMGNTEEVHPWGSDNGTAGIKQGPYTQGDISVHDMGNGKVAVSASVWETDDSEGATIAMHLSYEAMEFILAKYNEIRDTPWVPATRYIS